MTNRFTAEIGEEGEKESALCGKYLKQNRQRR